MQCIRSHGCCPRRSGILRQSCVANHGMHNLDGPKQSLLPLVYVTRAATCTLKLVAAGVCQQARNYPPTEHTSTTSSPPPAASQLNYPWHDPSPRRRRPAHYAATHHPSPPNPSRINDTAVPGACLLPWEASNHKRQVSAPTADAPSPAERRRAAPCAAQCGVSRRTTARTPAARLMLRRHAPTCRVPLSHPARCQHPPTTKAQTNGVATVACLCIKGVSPPLLARPPSLPQ